MAPIHLVKYIGRKWNHFAPSLALTIYPWRPLRLFSTDQHNTKSCTDSTECTLSHRVFRQSWQNHLDCYEAELFLQLNTILYGSKFPLSSMFPQFLFLLLLEYTFVYFTRFKCLHHIIPNHLISLSDQWSPGKNSPWSSSPTGQQAP